MNDIIRTFDQLTKEDVGIAGGKGANLGEMTTAGIPVPPGFVLLSSAFDYFMKELNCSEEINIALRSINKDNPSAVNDVSRHIQGRILDATIPKDIADAILKEFERLKTTFVAVRSSATAEDSVVATWAGQLDSYLNTTSGTLLENVKRCWSSLFTPRAIFYRFEKQLHQTKISVAVIVQKLVDSDISGVAFSVHPVTQDHNHLIIEAGYGLGEAIVSGQITPDSYVVEKHGWRVLDKHVATQERALRRVETGGNAWQPVSTFDDARQKLSDKQILELAKIVVRIETHFGFPSDIEWTMDCGNFSIVQSRPITTLRSK